MSDLVPVHFACGGWWRVAQPLGDIITLMKGYCLTPLRSPGWAGASSGER
jgi:hypothetical protein